MVAFKSAGLFGCIAFPGDLTVHNHGPAGDLARIGAGRQRTALIILSVPHKNTLATASAFIKSAPDLAALFVGDDYQNIIVTGKEIADGHISL